MIGKPTVQRNRVRNIQLKVLTLRRGSGPAVRSISGTGYRFLSPISEFHETSGPERVANGHSRLG
jgi:hypothetical protein